jgi:hypothetical protein
LIGAGAICALFLHDLSAARARLLNRSQTIATSFGTLEYALLGRGESVLVVHGASGGFDQGIELLGTVAERGFQLIAPSRFGYLRSTLPSNATTAMQADAYVQLLDHLGIKKWPLSASPLAPGRPCSSQSVIRNAVGGHALVGQYADVLRDTRSFIRGPQKEP